MAEWKIKRGDAEFTAADDTMLVAWAREGRVQASDYVLNPVLQQWMYARDAAELQGAFGSIKANTDANHLNAIGMTVGVLGLVALLFAPTIGLIMIGVGIVLSVMYYAKRR